MELQPLQLHLPGRGKKEQRTSSTLMDMQTIVEKEKHRK